MRRRPGLFWVAVVLATLAGCAASPVAKLGPDATVHDPAVFRSKVVDPLTNGSEPSLEIAPDGTIYICSPHASRGTDLYRSTDGGATFQSLGSRLVDVLPPHRALQSDAGGFDCDVGIDGGGRVYLVDGWVGSSSVAWSDDRGKTWDGAPTSEMTLTMDRGWALGGAPKELFVTGKDIQGTLIDRTGPKLLDAEPSMGGIWVSRSTDGGKTFSQQVAAVKARDYIGLNGNLASDGQNLYLYYTQSIAADRVAHMIAISKDHGLTWSSRKIAEQPFDPDRCLSYPDMIMPVVAADREGGVYVAWASQDPVKERFDLYFAASADGGEHWSAPVPLTDRAGTRMLPWIAADKDGHVGIVWYETNKTLYPQHVNTDADRATCTWGESEPTDWFIHYENISDARSAHPTFQEALVQTDPVTHAPFLNKPFAELMQVEFDPKGHAAVAYVSDTKDAPTRLMFAVRGS